MTLIECPFQNEISLTLIFIIRYLNPLKTSLTRFRTGQALRRGAKMKSFEGSFR